MPVNRLLVIDDDEVDRKSVCRALRSLGTNYEMQEACEGRQGVELAFSRRFDCILIDYHLPDMNGLDVLVELRERLEVAVPIIMLTGEGNELIAVEAMKRGAYDYLPKKQLAPDTLSRVVSHAVESYSLHRRLAETQQNLERLALYDTLTGLGNRNLFSIELRRAVAIAQRKNTSFFVLMMDLDRFKAANDTFGHEAGDAVLAAVGRRFRSISRAADAYFRFGGDEFTAILDAGSDGKVVAQRLRAAIAEPVSFGPHALAIGISIGLATFPADGANAEDLIRAADAAMYDAKKSDLGWALALNVTTEVQEST